MPRGYLNSLSFPAENVDVALGLLSELRKGIAHLLAEKAIVAPIMCGVRASQLPLTPEYETLATIAKSAPGGFRDTVLFFLTAFDQRSPVHVALEAADLAEAMPSIVQDSDCDFDPDAGTTLVACALDGGVLLSIGSDSRWRSSSISITMLTASASVERQERLVGVHDAVTANIAATAIDALRRQHRFANWEHLTGGAIRSAQLDDWFAECATRPGLEQLIMRTVANAYGRDWLPDGELVKKLHAGTSIMEVRAYFSGSNNVRLLFGRTRAGKIAFGYGGIKTSSDWYDHAVPQADTFLSSLE